METSCTTDASCVETHMLSTHFQQYVQKLHFENFIDTLIYQSLKAFVIHFRYNIANDSVFYAYFFNYQHAQPDPIEIQRQQENRRRAIARKRAKEQLRPRSPDPVEGRKHIDVQTELYLEELSDRVEEADVEVQTDAFLDRPPSPMYVPAKTGVDITTQILEGDVSIISIPILALKPR